MKKKNVGICRFCGQEKELIRAHIIPRHFYLNYEHKTFAAINTQTGNWKQCKTGTYYSNILCSDCDGTIIKLFEDEAYRILLNDIYIRKFFISVLWRASISKTDEFSNINLGPYEDIALKILKDEIEKDNLFKILIFKFPSNMDNNLVVHLSKLKIKHKAYCLCMAGYYIFIFVNEKNIPLDFIKYYGTFFINKENLYILESPEFYKKHCQHLYALRHSSSKLIAYLQKKFNKLGHI